MTEAQQAETASTEIDNQEPSNENIEQAALDLKSSAESIKQLNEIVGDLDNDMAEELAHADHGKSENTEAHPTDSDSLTDEASSQENILEENTAELEEVASSSEVIPSVEEETKSVDTASEPMQEKDLGMKHLGQLIDDLEEEAGSIYDIIDKISDKMQHIGTNMQQMGHKIENIGKQISDSKNSS